MVRSWPYRCSMVRNLTGSKNLLLLRVHSAFGPRTQRLFILAYIFLAAWVYELLGRVRGTKDLQMCVDVCCRRFVLCFLDLVSNQASPGSAAICCILSSNRHQRKCALCMLLINCNYIYVVYNLTRCCISFLLHGQDGCVFPANSSSNGTADSGRCVHHSDLVQRPFEQWQKESALLSINANRWMHDTWYDTCIVYIDRYTTTLYTTIINQIDNNQSLTWRYPVCSSLVYPSHCVLHLRHLHLGGAMCADRSRLLHGHHLPPWQLGLWCSLTLSFYDFATCLYAFPIFHIFPCTSFAWCRNNQDKSDFQKLFARKLHPSLIRCCWHVSDFYMRWWPCFTVRRSQPFAIQLCHSYLVDWSNTNESNRSSLGA